MKTKANESDKTIITKLFNWLKPGLDSKRLHPETSVYKKVFMSPEGEKVLRDLADRVYGRVIGDDASNETLRAWSGEIRLFKYILTKTYKEK